MQKLVVYRCPNCNMRYDGVITDNHGLEPIINFNQDEIVFLLKCRSCTYGSKIQISSMDHNTQNINKFTDLIDPIGKLLVTLFENEQDISIEGQVGFID